MPDAAPVQER